MSSRLRPSFWLRSLIAGWLSLSLLLLGSAAHGAGEDFLPPEQAFKVSARAAGERSLEVTFSAAPGYYLYREQFRFEAAGATLGTPALPAGKVKFDETFAKDVETYRNVVRVPIPVETAGREFDLTVTSQGCADAGLCYPPQQSAFKVSLAAFGGDGSVRSIPASEPQGAVSTVASSARAGSLAEAAGPSSLLGQALQDGRFWPVVGTFFLAGVLLSLTPCVLPMLPIITSIIAGQGGTVSRSRGLSLAAAYSFGMALVYTALGVAAGLLGEGLAAALQTPWVLGAFAIGLVVLSLSMFGVYELRPPQAFTQSITRASQRLPSGRIASVFAMGGVSALIVSPCVAAPLAGALVYLSQTRDVWLGGTALFSLAAGMSVPLLLVGASAGALLPRAGPWMDEVKRFFGIVLLGVALWTVQSVLPASLVLALWGVLALAAAVLLVSPPRGHRAGLTQSLPRRVAAAVMGAAGLLQLVGAASGGTDPLQPLASLGASGGADRASAPVFRTVRSVADLDAALRTANRPVMLDFYADWCVSCKEMERFTFADPAVRRKLEGALLLKADVTANNADDRALLRRFGLFGPPGTIFFDGAGREVEGSRVIGYQNATRFVETLKSVGL